MLRLVTKPIRAQEIDDCYQAIIDGMYAWHKKISGGPIPGYHEAQLTFWNDPDFEKNARKHEELTFEWGYALLGVDFLDISAEAKVTMRLQINNCYRVLTELDNIKNVMNLSDNVIRQRLAFRNNINLGRKTASSLSEQEHIGLIKYYNPLLKSFDFRMNPCPAAIEYALHKYGPLLVVGKLYFENEENKFNANEHTIMVMGIKFRAGQYFIEYQDGISPEIKAMSFQAFLNQIDRDKRQNIAKDAILYFDTNEPGFMARGNAEEGGLYRFQVGSKCSNVYFKKSGEELQSDEAFEITLNTDLAAIEEQEGYMYAAVPNSIASDRLNNSDLNYLSLVLFKDPADALKMLETTCMHKDDYARTVDYKQSMSSDEARPTKKQKTDQDSPSFPPSVKR